MVKKNVQQIKSFCEKTMIPEYEILEILYKKMLLARKQADKVVRLATKYLVGREYHIIKLEDEFDPDIYHFYFGVVSVEIFGYSISYEECTFKILVTIKGMANVGGKFYPSLDHRFEAPGTGELIVEKLGTYFGFNHQNAFVEYAPKK
jgi:hypothetical protein